MIKKYIALVYTPFQLSMVNCLIVDKLIPHDTLILDFSNQSRKSDHHYTKSNSFIKFTYEILKLRFFRTDYNSRIILIPHGFGVLSNIVLARNNYDEIRFYHEGILSFYTPQLENYKISTNKKLFSLLLFHRFSKAHVFDFSQGTIFYTPFPKLTIKKSNQLINFQLPDYKFSDPTPGRALILDSPNLNINRKIINAINKLLDENGIELADIKLHPSQKKRIKIHPFSDLLTCQTKFLNTNTGLEDLCQDLSPEIIISSMSSALFNLLPSNHKMKIFILIEAEKFKGNYLRFCDYLKAKGAIIKIV